MRIRTVSFLSVLLTTPALRADVPSGPTVGEKVPALKVFAVTGDHENKELDYAAERKDKPTIYVFIAADKFDRPMARFLKVLDGVIKKESDDAYVVAVWLTEDEQQTRTYLPRAQHSLQMKNTALTYFAGEKSGPKDWNINLEAHITIVVGNKQKVAMTIGERSINEEDVRRIVGELKKSLK